MWDPVLSILTLALLTANGGGYVPAPSPPACFQDGEVRFGANCDAVRMVMECIEMVVSKDAVGTRHVPVETPLVAVNVPDPEPPSLSSCAPVLP